MDYSGIMSRISNSILLPCSNINIDIDLNISLLPTEKLAQRTPDFRVLAVSLAVLLLAGATLPVAGTPPQTDTSGSVGSTDHPDTKLAQTGANTTDTDGDGLSDSLERSVYETDPVVADTDGDGYPDGMEVRCNQSLPSADPLRTDIYVEVDSTTESTLSEDAQTSVREAFASAPVANPDGSNGIDIYLRTNDTNLSSNGTVYSNHRDGYGNDLYDFRANHSDYHSEGYYYVLLTDDVAYGGDDYYVGAGRPGIAAMEPFDSMKITASLFMHEFGHAMGLDANQDGIDEERYTANEYDSVMNYNGLYSQLTYSDGTDSVGRNEWDFVAKNRTQPAIQCPENEPCASVCT